MAKNDEFETNLLRLSCASQYFLASMLASREMYGKGYFALGVEEKQALDQTVYRSIFGNLALITPATFAAPTQGQTGFQAPDVPTEGS